MPYISVQGTLPKCNYNTFFCFPQSTKVSGLKDSDKALLIRFHSTPSHDASTITYSHPPMAILNALEIIGYKVVTCTASYVTDSEENHYMWTMRKDFSEPEPTLECEKNAEYRM